LTIIIGIDPGSCITGYGVIDWQNNQATYLDSGCVRVTGNEIQKRLQQIFFGIQTVIEKYLPIEAAIEQIFMHQNPGAALKLGQARGAALVALNIPVAEYSARQVKQSVVGYGAADKAQVQHMVKILLNIKGKLQADAADALAIALCHAHARFSPKLLGTTGTRRKRSSWRAYLPTE